MPGFRPAILAAEGTGYRWSTESRLKSWRPGFLVMLPAIMQAYPGIPASLSQKAKYRDPDAIAGGTWEALERVLQKAGYFKAGLAKIEAARSIARKMNPQQNRSRSFRCFRDALITLLPADGSASRILMLFVDHKIDFS